VFRAQRAAALLDPAGELIGDRRLDDRSAQPGEHRSRVRAVLDLAEQGIRALGQRRRAHVRPEGRAGHAEARGDRKPGAHHPREVQRLGADQFRVPVANRAQRDDPRAGAPRCSALRGRGARAVCRAPALPKQGKG
jgi:hypothetical protein